MYKPIFASLLFVAIISPSVKAENFNSLLQQAMDGDAKAEFEVGYRYDLGEDVKQDFKKAVYWYQRSSNQNYMPAKTNLGWLYQNGLGVEQDYRIAMSLYTQAAEAGDSQAQHNLACMYDQGLGMQRDLQLAVKWYVKAAQQGHPAACLNLGVCYWRGEGVARDLVQAYRWVDIARFLLNDKRDKWRARGALDEIKKNATPSQIQEAKQLIQDWHRQRQKNQE
ncbi:MAG: tetratricopeptide repeat protein [Phycisphaeraceae bacterium JB051]